MQVLADRTLDLLVFGRRERVGVRVHVDEAPSAGSPPGPARPDQAPPNSSGWVEWERERIAIHLRTLHGSTRA